MQQNQQYTQFTPTSANTAMMMSIVSIFCFGILLAIPALIMANGAKKITDAQPGHPDASSANVAKIVSILVILFYLAFMALYLVFFIFVGVNLAAAQ